MKNDKARFDFPKVYLDFAATTPVDPRVVAVMEPFLSVQFANPRSPHAFGRNARKALDEARARVGAILGVTADEIRFTASGTDANVKAMLGVVGALQDEGRELSTMHLIISAIEHSSVRECAEMLSRRGVSVTYAPVAHDGIVDVSAFEKLVRDSTVFVSIMLVNNEIGTIQPLRQIAKILKERSAGRKQNIVFHTDASQAPLWISVRPQELGVSMLTLDGHKIYGPKGVGMLFVSHGTPYAGIIGMRNKRHDKDDGMDATPNMPGIIGFSEALSLCEERRATAVPEVEKLRDYCIERLEERFSDVRIHGNRTQRVANNINVSFPNIEGEFLVSQLSVNGIAASAKSACLSAGEEGSYVIAALDPQRKNNAIRLTLGYDTTTEDIDYLISVLVDVVA